MKLNKYTHQAKDLLAAAIILGSAYTFIQTIGKVIDNNYFHYNLYNLILFELQKNLNEYLGIFLLIALLTIVLFIVAKLVINSLAYIFSSIKNINYIKSAPFIFCLKLSIIITIILFALGYSKYFDIYAITEHIPESIKGFIVPITKTTYIFLAGVFGLLTLLFTLLTAVIFSKLNIIEDIQLAVSKILNSTKTKAFTFIIIGFIIFYNLFIFGYKKINSPEGPNIILISIDTVRADHLGSYGHERTTTPNIDNLAKWGVLFENAFSQAPWTLPAMTTIMTSLYPSEHGALTVYSKLNENFVTIAEFLNNNFYNTIGVISQSFVSSKHGFSQGFQIFDENYISGVNDVSSKFITEQAINHIEDKGSQSFFLWVHYFDPHHSYIDHKEFDYGESYRGGLPQTLDIKELNHDNKPSLNEEDIEYVKNIYDEELSLTDEYIGDLIDSLNEQGLEDNTIIIITADHGEEFLERTRFGHGKNLYQELIHVPLIVYVPDELKLRGKRIKNNVELRSIPYTILELIGIENNLFGGVNILSLSEKDISAVFSEGSYAWGEDHRKEGIIYKNWKLIKNLDDQSYELYDISNDPYEKRNLIESPYPGDINPVQDLQKQLSNLKKDRAQESDKVKFNKEDVERLKALGYIQ